MTAVMRPPKPPPCGPPLSAASPSTTSPSMSPQGPHLPRRDHRALHPSPARPFQHQCHDRTLPGCFTTSTRGWIVELHPPPPAARHRQRLRCYRRIRQGPSGSTGPRPNAAPPGSCTATGDSVTAASTAIGSGSATASLRSSSPHSSTSARIPAPCASTRARARPADPAHLPGR